MPLPRQQFQYGVESQLPVFDQEINEQVAQPVGHYIAEIRRDQRLFHPGQDCRTGNGLHQQQDTGTLFAAGLRTC